MDGVLCTRNDTSGWYSCLAARLLAFHEALWRHGVKTLPLIFIYRQRRGSLDRKAEVPCHENTLKGDIIDWCFTGIGRRVLMQ